MPRSKLAKGQQRQLGKKRRLFSLYLDPDVLDLVTYYSEKLNISKASVIEKVLHEATGKVMRGLIQKVI